MVDVVKFEDKVKAALHDVMRHAVAGHYNGGYNVFCADADHALEILRDAGIQPMNAVVAEHVLDKQ